tara:strand:- start:7783 stop:8259 length:477 start_codon:yes stop_codon:yes gene_type:complete
MTPERKQAFLDHLRLNGLVILAAKHATPNSPLGAKVSFYQERDRDPEFAAAWEEAIDESEELLLGELKRRGIDGYDEDVYGSLGNNMGTGPVGTKKVYSDKMAELYSRVKSARIRQGLANKIEVTATVDSSLGLDKLSPAKLALLEQLLEEDPKDEAQ